jgi:uncharacterized protein YcbK (DUF882 family)
MPSPPRSFPRRRLLAAFAAAPVGLAATRFALAAEAPRTLSFHHTHTDEALEVTYFEHGIYLEDALAQVDRLLRDFRTGEVAPIDPALLDILHRAATVCGGRRFEVISGYRSAVTNSSLADRSSGVARNSLHLQGRAIDVRLTGYDTVKLRHACVALGLGGVGYYPSSDFVHLDTGRVRTWGPASG